MRLNLRTAVDLSGAIGHFVRLQAGPPDLIELNTTPGTASLGVLIYVATIGGVQFGEVVALEHSLSIVTDGVPIPATTKLQNDALGRAVAWGGGANVMAGVAQHASIGSTVFAQVFASPRLAVGGGGGVIVADRRNHSVNGASIDEFASEAPIMRTNTNVNNAGAFNGGGTGNKSILGHWLPAPIPIGSLISIQLDYERITPEVGGGLIDPYLNMLVELDPVGSPGLLSVLVFGDKGAAPALNTGVFTTTGLNKFRTLWTPAVAGSFVFVVLNKGTVAPGPPVPVANPAGFPPDVVLAEGVAGAWPTHTYSIAALLNRYPAARIVNGDSGDGGLPKTTQTAGLMAILGDSTTVKQQSIRVNGWLLNGTAI
jgi:hypothetical protein